MNGFLLPNNAGLHYEIFFVAVGDRPNHEQLMISSREDIFFQQIFAPSSSQNRQSSYLFQLPVREEVLRVNFDPLG
eukprot:TRINITY_DN3378_c0_g1_i2.p1 TRINITY_DN3378_c0_g1~~TRINITY_DN3378_c0_g1_i2.p1  ORF type:complete len:76 (+),score=10.21 TRINITY_DN3378_c0_g1_i2:276-503(+)